MTTTKKVPASFAVSPELHVEAKEYCERKGVSFSEFLCLLIAKAIKLPIDDEPVIIGKSADEDIVPIVLKLPRAFIGNQEKLKVWMDTQSKGIIAKLGGN